MKNYINNLLVLILLALTGFFLQSCIPSEEDCSPVETETYPIYDGVRAKIPYSGYDTLTFVRTSTGDTHTFIGQGPKEGYNMTTATRTSEDCPPDNAKMGWINYTFISNTFSSKITFNIYYPGYGQGPNIAFNFNGQNFQRGSNILNPIYLRDSIIIGVQTFYDYATISSPEEPVTDHFFVLYNRSFGILKFKLKTGEEWNLLSKK